MVGYVPDLKKNALFSIIIVCIFANVRKKPYLCTIKITNNRAAQLVKLCNKDMTTIACTNSTKKAVRFFDNGTSVIASAMQLTGEYGDGWEYWFTIGEYSSMKAAVRYATSKMAKHGYTLAI